MSSLVSKLFSTALYVSDYPLLMGDICFEPLLQNNALFKILKFLVSWAIANITVIVILCTVAFKFQINRKVQAAVLLAFFNNGTGCIGE